jgi:hypothetical protein
MRVRQRGIANIGRDVVFQDRVNEQPPLPIGPPHKNRPRKIWDIVERQWPNIVCHFFLVRFPRLLFILPRFGGTVQPVS